MFPQPLITAAARVRKPASGLRDSGLKIPRPGEAVKVDRETFDQKVEKMASDGLASGSPDNNPLVPTAEQIIELYQKAW